MSTQNRNPVRSSLGTSSLFFFVIAAAAPLTSIAGFAPLAFLIGGPATPLGFIVAGSVYLVFAIGFLNFVRHTTRGGAFYTYVSIGLGPHLGLGAALMAYVAYTLGQVGFCAAAGLFTREAIHGIFGTAPSWGACALGLTFLCGLMAYHRIEFNARVMALLILAEIGILALFATVVFIKGGAQGIRFESLDPSALLSPGTGTLLVLAFVVFIGFEQAALYSEEVHDPKRTIPRATYLAIGFLTLFYLFTSWSIYIAIGPDQFQQVLAVDTTNLVFNLANRYLGSFWSSLMLILVVTSFFAGVLALQNASSRYLLSIAQERMLPAPFARRNRHGVPSFAGLFQAVLVGLVMLLAYCADIDPYRQLIIWTNTPTLVGVLILQVLASLAAIRHFHGKASGTTYWQRFIAPASASVMLLSVLGLLVRDMPLLTGLSQPLNAAILLPLVLAFGAGVIRSLRLNGQVSTCHEPPVH
ncbi:APC family permease [Pseudomonas sp. MPFS]|uniref:APC family permease n=1 Tax=Pseudomonas sp. MPFS TaxID=2795724 RepID=UPI001F13D690|nr:APC family permease [Pseudomonas sp. MPFS]UMZ10572.1 APC family permease [Pseudomonas sp. MPFS]